MRETEKWLPVLKNVVPSYYTPTIFTSTIMESTSLGYAIMNFHYSIFYVLPSIASNSKCHNHTVNIRHTKKLLRTWIYTWANIFFVRFDDGISVLMTGWWKWFYWYKKIQLMVQNILFLSFFIIIISLPTTARNTVSSTTISIFNLTSQPTSDNGGETARRVNNNKKMGGTKQVSRQYTTFFHSFSPLLLSANYFHYAVL